MDHVIEIDGTKYCWSHHGCKCSGHCNTDSLTVDGEAFGTVDNAELCSMIVSMIDEINTLREKLK